MNAKIIKQIMHIKHYNKIEKLNFEKVLIKSWNIFRKQNDENEKFKNENSFEKNVKQMLKNHNWKIWKW